MALPFRQKLNTSLIYLFLVAYALVVIYPMLWMLATSLKSSWEIFKSPWAMPTDLRVENYVNAWTAGRLGRKFINSVAVGTVSLALILVLGGMAAYALSRFRFFLDRVITYLFIAGMGLPVFLGIIPLFLLMNRLGLYSSPYGLVLVYVAFSLPFAIFILTGFFRTLPYALAEAAHIDGASSFGVFWHIMLPLAKPGMVTAGIFTFIGLWNEYPLALVLLHRDEVQTLPIGIASLTMTQRYQADWGALFASLAIGVIPTVIAYALFQKQIQSGLVAGAIK